MEQTRGCTICFVSTRSTYINHIFTVFINRTFYIRSLVPAELNNFAGVFVGLNGTVTTKVLLESLADALDIQIVRQSSDSSNTLSSVSLLDTNMDLLFSAVATIASVVKRVCAKEKRIGMRKI
jgi:hypothetical protein